MTLMAMDRNFKTLKKNCSVLITVYVTPPFCVYLQVTDMMLANSSNLIITVKPANQRSLAAPRRGSFSRNSQLSSGSHQSTQSAATTTGSDEDRFDQDEIVDFTGVTLDESGPVAPSSNNNTSVTTINTTVTTIGSNKEEAVLHL